MSEEITNISFPCSSCGGNLVYKPGEDHMVCPYCGTPNEIASDDSSTAVEEKDYSNFLKKAQEGEESIEQLAVTCQGCGAEVTLEENQTAGECPFCGTSLVAQSHSIKLIKPQSVLPFKINKEQATLNFKEWIKKLRFAPNKLKKYARHEGFKGIYLPFWTYDSQVHTPYVGAKGVYYYVTETYTVQEDGKSVTKTRQVQKTRWYPRSGEVDNSFDDVLVPAASHLPEEKLRELEPWDLDNLVSYDPKYIAGFSMESYTIDLGDGFIKAKEYMSPTIEDTIRRDIGGDTQRISIMSPEYEDITFKHILLPVWLSAYKYKNKVYQFMINARTGEVQGTRPYSVFKIVLAVLSVALLVGGGYLLYRFYN
jgi:predicted RNA-binding Zn-ribbon protein involved in translation (DUF1610 family)